MSQSEKQITPAKEKSEQKLQNNSQEQLSSDKQNTGQTKKDQTVLGKRSKDNFDDRSDLDKDSDIEDDKSNNENAQETAANLLKTRGIGVTRDRRPKTIMQTMASNETAQANAIADKQKQTKKEQEKKQKKTKEIKIDAVIPAKQTNTQITYQQAARQFLYKPFVLLPDLSDLINRTIEVRIHKSYLTKFNKAVQYQMFYGNDFYSSDSDVVCILQHQGVINLIDREPTDFEGIAAYFKVSKNRNNYANQYKNGILSKKKKDYEGNSLKYDNYCYYLNKQDF